MILEPIFLLGYHMKMDYTTVYNIPVVYKRWLVSRLAKQKENEAEQANGGQQRQAATEPSPFANSPFKDASVSSPKSSNSKRFG